MLQILAEGVAQRDAETLALVAASTQRGNTFLERLMDQPSESAAIRAELLALVAPILFIARSVAEKTADAGRA